MQLTSHSEKETIKLGQKLARQFRGGEIILLQGNLGSGKTILTKGIAKGLGIGRIINSPTFVLIKIYPVPKKRGNKKVGKQIKYLVHADAYRLPQGEQLLDAGLKEYLGRQDTVVVVEWGERLRFLTKKLTGVKSIRLKIKNNSHQIII
ncbi:MAG: tRNA (adenosine(37)-N6)-threonylcarbamoyltransferase complex ATPase subunit type 1 TsaE [Patescibacteria group bacterium]